MNLSRMPLAILSASLLARTIGPTGVGFWALIMAVTGLMHAFLLNWTQPASIRFGTEEWISNGQLAETWASRWPIIFLGISVSVLILIFQPFSFLEHFFSLPSSLWPLLIFFLIGRWFLAEVQNLYRITGNLIWFGSISIIIDFVTILFLLSIFFMGLELKLNFVIFGMAFILSSISALAWLIEFRSSNCLGGKRDYQNTLKIIKYAFPVIPGLGLAYLLTWLPLLILQHIGSIKDVGLFNVGFQVMSALMGLATPLSILFLPKLIDKKKWGNDTGQHYLTHICPAITVIWLIAIIPILAFIPYLFSLLFGDTFQASIPIVLILCAAVPGAVFTALYATLFEVQGRLGRSSFYTAIMLLVTVICTVILLPLNGLTALAIATCISYIVTQTLYILDQHIYLKTPAIKTFVLLIFSSFYGLLQCLVASHFVMRIGISLLSLVILFFIVNKFKCIDQSLLKTSFHQSIKKFGFRKFKILINPLSE